MKKLLLSLSVLFLSALTTHAQTDVTSTYLDNADFSSGTAVTTGVCTYAKDVSGNSADGSSLMTVDNWTAGVTGDSKAGGLFTYGSSAWCGKNADNYKVPATNPDGTVSGNALGIIGVWTGEAFYTQEAKTPLKPGKYTITFKIYNSVGTVDIDTNKFGFVESDGTTTHYGSTKTFTVGQWVDEKVTFTLTEETSGTFSVGYKSANNGSGTNQARLFFVDNVKIEFSDDYATDEQKTALNSAITAAKAHTLGFDKDEYAPYNNVVALTALATAETLAAETSPISSEVVSATTALTSATWKVNTEALDAVYDGNLNNKEVSAKSGDADPLMKASGWTTTGSFRMILGDTNSYPALTETEVHKAVFVWGSNPYNYGENTGYTMPLDANTVYELSFKYTGWDGAVKSFSVSVLNNAKEGLASTKLEGSSAGVNTAGTFISKKIYFTTGSAGNYVLSFYPDGNATFADIHLVKAEATNVTIQEAASNTDNTAYYATCQTATPVNLDECQFEAFAVKVTDGVISYTKAEGTVPTGTNLLIRAANYGQYEAVLGLSSNAQTLDTDLKIAGSDEKGDGYTKYILFKGAEGLGWYLCDAEASINEGVCYLVIESTSTAKFIGIGNDATGISSLSTDKEQSGVRYNVSGQRVGAAYKGIVIENGKKYLVK